MKKAFKKTFKWIKNRPIWQKILFFIIIFLIIILCIFSSFMSSKINKMQTEKIEEEEIIINDEVLKKEKEYEIGKGYTNFVLFGGDSREHNVENNLNTDTIIIVSLNNETKEIKMVSVYRDTLLDVGNNTIKKCNSAYGLGGPKNAINMLNKNLDLNIRYYVTVDFSMVVDIVDMVGGIEVDVSEAEYKAVNDYMGETAMVAGKEAIPLTHAGVQILDGVQATTYARIRKGVGDDYARTARQRLVIEKIAEKVLSSNISLLNDIIDEALPRISTNMTMSDIIKYTSLLPKYKIGENSGFPFEKSSGYVKNRGSCVYAISLNKNVSMLHEFLYRENNYQPSKTVQELDSKIDAIVKQHKIPGTEVGNDPAVDASGEEIKQNSSKPVFVPNEYEENINTGNAETNDSEAEQTPTNNNESNNDMNINDSVDNDNEDDSITIDDIFSNFN